MENTGYGFTARMLKLRCDGTVLLCVAMPHCHPVNAVIGIALYCNAVSSHLLSPGQQYKK